MLISIWVKSSLRKHTFYYTASVKPLKYRMLQSFLDTVLGSYNQKQVEKTRNLIPKINKFEAELQALTDDQLKARFADWREILTANPEKSDKLMYEVFAGIKDACRRMVGNSYPVMDKEVLWEMIPYDVQLIGGIVLHQGKITEMKTGEGKTLSCTLPVILNALTGKGVHVITVNDYLAERDAEWMKPLYEFCGLTTGVIISGVTPEERRAAYAADITYGTNNEFGFDYLRDNMAQRKSDQVQRGLHFAIVDEVDSILIDEARTPLIISTAAEASTDKYGLFAQIIPQLKVEQDYVIDYKQKSVQLTEPGVKKLEGLLGMDHLFTEGGFEQIHHIENALKAHVIMKKDQDYVIQDGKIVIVDEFTGRLMPGRRFSDGLHQSLESKENVEIQRESKTLATITFQNYFRLYEKLAGMTGTAETEAEEFAKIYKLDTVVIPTNRPIQRADLPDKIFKNERGKFTALARTVKKLHENGQPVLIGTVNIDKSEELSGMLKASGIPHEILNAKQHEREAEIVAKAGQPGAVTIATNMAGRGTDIKLGEGVKEAGGLAIIGTERHESRRIDNQLRGRAGRQGDPGFSQFYVAMTDQLMRRFGGDKMAGVMERMGLPEDEAIENRMISGSVENAQKKIEGFHFDARKHVVQYDDVMNIHREKIYARRRKLLGSEAILEDVDQTINDLVGQVVDHNCPTPQYSSTWDLDEVTTVLGSIHPLGVDTDDLSEYTYRDELNEKLSEIMLKAWSHKKEQFPAEVVDDVARQIILRSIDQLWLEHIDEMTHLRDRVALSGYAQKDPIMEYKAESFRMFSGLLQTIRMTAISNLFRVQFKENLKIDTQDYSEAETNAADINASLENTAEYEVGQKSQKALSRQQRRAQERENKK